MNLKIIIIACISVFIYGCASMNANQCTTASWEAVGYQDGSRGQDMSRFNRHSKACAKHGISANFNEYKAGHQQGVRAYCTPELGFSLGKRNRGIPGICPEEVIHRVRLGYDAGHDIYLEKRELYQQMDAAKAELKLIDDQSDELNQELAEHERYLQLAEDGLRDPKVRRSERLIFYTQRAQMKKLIREKIAEINNLYEQREPYENTIDRLKEDIQYLDSRPMPKLQ